jgi:hypothetical protein
VLFIFFLISLLEFCITKSYKNTKELIKYIFINFEIQKSPYKKEYLLKTNELRKKKCNPENMRICIIKQRTQIKA